MSVVVVRKNLALKIGFVPLLDAAPLVAAFELGFFAEEGLSVVLERQIGWGNVRDKLTFGHLDASHALLGMPVASFLTWPQYPEPLVSLLSLGFGGNAITVSNRLFNNGVRSASLLGEWIRRMPRDAAKLAFAHVFGCSSHHYLLREWLVKAEVDPDRDVRLCILPPPQMVRQISNHYVDGFCVGEPWNSVAESEGVGKALAVTTDIVPGHPEKVLAVTRRWLKDHADAAFRIVRALMRAGDFCGKTENRNELIGMLSGSRYLGVDPAILARSFNLDRQLSSTGGSFYGISIPTMFPSATQVSWLVSQVIRWGHAPADIDADGLAARCVDSGAYRAVAAEWGVDCPLDDYPPMRLRNGWFKKTPSSKEQTSLSSN